MTPRPDPADDQRSAFDRRTVLRGVAATGALGASAGLLAGCGDSGDSGGSGGSGNQAADGSGSGSGSRSGPGSGTGGQALASASQIPVGGGMVFAEQQVVVTQPTKGDFQGLSAVCTHQGCTVGEVAGGTINCPCHGSRFHLDGTVANGPAEEPLPKKRIEVAGGEIRLA